MGDEKIMFEIGKPDLVRKETEERLKRFQAYGKIIKEAEKKDE